MGVRLDPSRATTTRGIPKFYEAQDEDAAALEITELIIELTRIKVCAEAVVAECEVQPYDMPPAVMRLKRELES